MKKISFILLVAVLSFCILAPMALAADKPITMEVNGVNVKPDVAPFVVNGVTMVPLRFVGQPMQATLLWDGAAKKATLIKDAVQVDVVMGKKTASVNGEEKPLLEAAREKGGRTFIPLRFVAESLGAQVEWLPKNSLVTINFPGSAAPFKITGYYYDANSLTMLQDYHDSFNDIIHFGYRVTGDGTVLEKANFSKDLFESQAYDYAVAEGIKPLLLVTCFEKANSDTLLSSSANRANAIANIVDMMKKKGFSGVDLDFEAVSVANRADFAVFVRDLKAAMGKEYLLSLSVPPKNNDKQTWRDGYDYQALAQSADQVIVMFYNEHYSGGTAGPVAGADWLEQGIEYMSQYIPMQKMHIGLGAYGYSWPTAGTGGGGSSLHIARCRELIAEKGVQVQRDAKSGVPYFDYVGSDGIARQAWFEDGQSLAQKATIAKKSGAAGIAVWRMGFVPNDVWDDVLKSIQ
ncbi:MAG: glycosyl hydrolase family 18 protein [Clostridiales bacterium]